MPAPGIIAVSPVGEGWPAELIEGIAGELQRVFGYPVESVTLLTDIDFAYNAARDQYHSTPILERLAERAPGRFLKVVGVTRADLFIPILTHVFGEAQLGGRACIVSMHRLNAVADADLRYRLAKEAIHELGHTFKLRHCREKTCIMHYCRSVADVDRKSDSLCRYCSVLLADEQARLARLGTEDR